MDSILDSIKATLGLTPEYTPFDNEIILHINSAMTVLSQLGVGPEGGIFITGSEETWDQVFGDSPKINLIKSWMGLKVKLLFDPPNSGVLHEAMERQVTEFEWRINVQAETGPELLRKEGEIQNG